MKQSIVVYMDKVSTLQRAYELMTKKVSALKQIVVAENKETGATLYLDVDDEDYEDFEYPTGVFIPALAAQLDEQLILSSTFTPDTFESLYDDMLGDLK